MNNFSIKLLFSLVLLFALSVLSGCIFGKSHPVMFHATAVYPEASATQIPVNAPVIVNLSGDSGVLFGGYGADEESVNSTTFIVTDPDGNIILGSIICENKPGFLELFASPTSFRFSPNSNLDFFKTYTVKLTTGIKSEKSNNNMPLDKETVFRFTTQSQINGSSYSLDSMWSITDTGMSVATPSHIAISRNADYVYVLDSNLNQITKYDASGNLVSHFGGSGSGNGLFSGPQGIAVDSSGNLYVLDSGNFRVQKFSSDGIFLLGWGTSLPWEGEQSYDGNGRFYSPKGIAVDNSDVIYVTDSKGGTGDKYIQKFNANGAFISHRKISVVDLWSLKLISIDASNNIFVSGGYFVHNLSGSGVKWTTTKTGFPRSIANDGSGNVYVCTDSNIQKFTGNGEFVTEWGSSGSDQGQFNNPNAVAVSSNGKVYVVDQGNKRIQVFH